VPASLSTSSTGGSSPPTASASQPANSGAAPPSPGLGTGAKAGIGSGVAVVLILLVVIAFLIKKLTQKKKQGEVEKPVDAPQSEDEEKAYMAPHVWQHGPVEMHVDNLPVEIDNRYVAELPGSHGCQEKSAS
jgi:hypothetical protein